MVPLFFDYHGPHDSHVILVRHPLQCLTCLAAPWLRQLRTVGAETCAEHLRHNGYVGFAGYGCQTFIKQTHIGLRVCPYYGVLQ
jgi:hypothetical protein